MRPEDVNPRNFKVENIVYNRNGFSIAVGIWQDDSTRRLAMRWNEQGNTDADNSGYPTVFGHPMWFQLPDDDDINEVLQSLVDNNPNR